MLGTTPLERTVELLALTTTVAIFISGIMAMTGVSNPLLPQDWDPTAFEATNDNTVVLSSTETVIRQSEPEPWTIPELTPALKTGILWSVGSCYALVCYFCGTGVVAGSSTEAAMRDELGVKMRSGTCCLTCCFLILYIFGLMQIFADHPDGGTGSGGVTICVLLILVYVGLRIRKRQQDALKVEASLQQDASAAVGAAATSGAYGSAPPNAYGDPYGASAPGAPAPEYDEKF